jgi:hypothetical protein
MKIGQAPRYAAILDLESFETYQQNKTTSEQLVVVRWEAKIAIVLAQASPYHRKNRPERLQG